MTHTLLRDEPLARHTTWRVGGPAARFHRPADRAALHAVLRALPADEPLLWLGLGSNLLVSDQGFLGTVIQLRGLNGIVQRDTRLWCEAGVAGAPLARYAARAGLGGIEFLAGIPGTLGGALAMNAGAWGDEIWSRVTRVWTIDRRGGEHERLPCDFTIGYRHVVGPPGEWFLAAELALTPAEPAAVGARMRDLLAQRAARQPIGQPSAGSVFRNPPGDYAARLIDTAGLKGAREGDAEVSPKHANFIVNRGQARAADIDRLIRRVQQTVAARHGVTLELEIHRIGVFDL